MSEFLNMGGYGFFVWTAYGLSALVLVGLLFQSHRFLKSSEADLSSLQETTTGERNET